MQYSVVVNLGKVGQFEGLHTRIMSVDGCAERVAESLVGRYGTVLQAHFQAFHQVVECLLVFINLGEVQVNQLEHRFNVLRRGVCTNTHALFAHRKASRCVLSGEGFAQLGVREVGQSAYFEGAVEDVEVSKVGRAIARTARSAATRKAHFVFLIVGFLQQYGYAVREFQLGIAELRTAFLADNLAGFGQFGDERLVLHVVYIRR